MTRESHSKRQLGWVGRGGLGPGVGGRGAKKEAKMEIGSAGEGKQ